MIFHIKLFYVWYINSWIHLYMKTKCVFQVTPCIVHYACDYLAIEITEVYDMELIFFLKVFPDIIKQISIRPIVRTNICT